MRAIFWGLAGIGAALCVGKASLVSAQALPIEVPDGRIDLVLQPNASDGGLELCLLGDLGSLGLDNCVRLGTGGLELTNPPMGDSLLLSPEGFELTENETYGPRAANASLGTGGLTAGINRDGRLTSLGWPGPGLYDHINYLNLSQGLPNKGAFRNAGSFGGVDGEWLIGSDGWEVIDQRYANSNTQTLITKLENIESGLRVTITDIVHPEKDLMARNFTFSRPPQQGFHYYANMNPTTSRIPRVPSVTDAFLDPATDFATVYTASDGALLHFRPFQVDPTSLTRIATSQLNTENALDAVAGSFGRGVYVAVAGQSMPSSFQAGTDTLGLLRSEVEGTPLIDPFYDIEDGQLSGAPMAVGKTAGGLAGLAPDADGSYTVYIAASDRPNDALRLIREARQQGFTAMRAASEADWRHWISRARLPATQDQRTRDVSKRALITIRTAADRETGAILAATTPQTPYRQDWVRDGAFFKYALLIAGYSDIPKANSRFLTGIYRDLPILDGTWDTFYYPDGAEAGAVFPYEIDAQGLVIWSLWLPYAIGERDIAYLEAVYPAMEDTANALLRCYDPRNGLQCTAPEDDVLVPSQGAQGAAAVHLGYQTAIRAAEALGRAPNPQWQARADELKAAVLDNLCDDDGCQGGRGGIYLAWPSEVLEADNPDTAELLQRHYQQFAEQLDRRSGFQAPEVGGFFQYPMESIMALGLDWKNPRRAARLDGWIKWLTHDVAEPGVLHYGERIFRDGERSYRHSVGFPHIWSGAEVYIAAAHVYGLEGCPGGVDRIGDAPCSRSRGGVASGNAGVAGTESGGGGSIWLLALAAVLGVRYRAARRLFRTARC